MTGKWDNKLLNRICAVTHNNPKHIKTIIKELAQIHVEEVAKQLK